MNNNSISNNESINLSEMIIPVVLLPKVVLKVAQSLDGKINTSSGQSKWITNNDSRLLTHKIRSESDAIIVGINTVMKDNPSLTVRLDNKIKVLWRVILNSSDNIPLDSNVFGDDYRNHTIMFVVDNDKNDKKLNNLKTAGVKIHKLKLINGDFDLNAVLEVLSTYQIKSVMVEGGAKTLSTFIAQNIFDELHIFIAPKIFGEGTSSFSGFDAKKITNSPKLILSDSKIIIDSENIENNIYLKLIKG